jgi:hypothetical protein
LPQREASLTTVIFLRDLLTGGELVPPRPLRLHRIFHRLDRTSLRLAHLFDHLAGPVAIKSLHITIVMQRFISEISS